MIVQKFGGTSIEDAARMQEVATILARQQVETNDPGVVVVSAMSGVTDALIRGGRAAAEGDESAYRTVQAGLLSRHLAVLDELIPQGAVRLELGGWIEDQLHEVERLYRSIAVLGEMSPRGADAVASFGEILSSNLLAAILMEKGIPASPVSAVNLITTDSRFGAAALRMEPTRERVAEVLSPILAEGIMPVVTGYIASTEQGAITTLGRGGSDYSAAIIGAALGAEEVWIWSDVDGILTADPNLVSGARTIDELTYPEALELAEFGAEVLHPRTIQPLLEANIPLRILNSYNPGHPGTRIVTEPDPVRVVPPAIISASGMSMITIGADRRWNLLNAAEALTALSSAGVDVLMFSRSFSERSLTIIVNARDAGHCMTVLRDVFPQDEEEGLRLFLEERAATVSVVSPARNDSGIVSAAFQALGACGTRVIAVAQASTEFSVSFCIPEDQLRATVRFLHHALHGEDG